jgi:hypothetical protein
MLMVDTILPAIPHVHKFVLLDNNEMMVVWNNRRVVRFSFMFSFRSDFETSGSVAAILHRSGHSALLSRRQFSVVSSLDRVPCDWRGVPVSPARMDTPVNL